MTEDETSFTPKEKIFINACLFGGIGVGYAGLGLALGAIGLAAVGPVGGGIFAGA